MSIDHLSDFDYEYTFKKEKEQRRKSRSGFKSFPGYLRDAVKTIELNRVYTPDASQYRLRNFYTRLLTTYEYLLALPGLVLIERDLLKINEIISNLIASLKDGLMPISYPFSDFPADETTTRNIRCVQHA